MLTTLAGHENYVFSAQFSPDGMRILTASDDKTVRVWDVATGKLVVTLAGHEAGVRSVQFSPVGTRILTASQDKTGRLWDVLPSSAGPPPEWFPDFLRFMAQKRLNSDGELEPLKAVDWLALRERLRGVVRADAGKETPYLRILSRYVGE
jgi:WD40 repeat protein